MKNLLLILCVTLLISCDKTSENTKTEQQFLTSIQGTWRVSEIKDVTKEDLSNSQKTPFIQFDKEKISGTNGCNNYFSSVKNIAENSIEFSTFGETKMMCQEMKIPDAFNMLLFGVETYSVNGNTLSFFNNKEEKVLTFVKE